MKKHTLLALSALFSAAHVSSAATITVPLSSSAATGYLAFIGMNQETSEPNSGGKVFDYPYYDSPSVPGNFYVMQVEPFTPGLSFPNALHPTGPSTNVAVSNFVDGTTADADFSISNIGSISYDDASLTGIGTETIPTAGITLSLVNDDFVPDASRFPMNEFPNGVGAYSFTPTALAGSGLTFTNGQLTSIDFIADVTLTATLFVSSDYTGQLIFSGDTFTYDIDDTQDFVPFATNVRTIVNRSGSIDAVPEPSASILVFSGILSLLIHRKR